MFRAIPNWEFRMMTIAPLTRRRLLATAAATSTLTLAGGIARPYLSRAGDRPRITHGLQSGDTSINSGVVWARTDRPARLTFDLSTTDSFKTIARSVTLDALPESDFAVKALIDGLPSGQDVFYRVRSVDLSDTSVSGEPATGRFRTAPTDRRNIAFVWSGDTAGQGWGIDEARGGMKIYETMRKLRPDFFIHSGDTIYADGAIQAEQKLPDGTMWKNLVLEEKTKVAETLAEYRASYKYNLLDKNLRAFNAEIPMLAQWDDHEVLNNWSSSKNLMEDKRY
jgi:alkaline phosphatase D